MISFEEAQRILYDQLTPMEASWRALEDAYNYILAEDVHSPVDDPPFDKSAMDGYALGKGSLEEGASYQVIGSIPAGNPPPEEVLEGCCYRIFTGAAVPLNAQAVVQQEHVRSDGDTIVLEKPQTIGKHIRRKGEQVMTDALALPKGTRMNPGAVAFLKGLGIAKIKVYDRPSVGIMITGNEFAQRPEDLQSGKIFDANAPLLRGILDGLGLEHEIRFAPDDPSKLKEVLGSLRSKHKVILVTGGVSVGDHDHTPEVVKSLGFDIQFHRVRQKPGKPILFASYGDKLLFGLPGNPLSVFVCFHLYVRPAILSMTQAEQGLSVEGGTVDHPIENKAFRKEFALAKWTRGGRIELLRMRASHMLIGLAEAQLLAVIDPESNLEEGQDISYISLQ
jgi:molybdopterin molybdotransferase